MIIITLKKKNGYQSKNSSKKSISSYNKRNYVISKEEKFSYNIGRKLYLSYKN